MILISIAAVGATPSADVVNAIRSVTGAPIASILKAIRNDAVIYERDFLARPRESTFSEMRQLIQNLEELSLSLRVRENGREIWAEILKNMMRSTEESDQHLRDLDELGHQ